MRNGGTTGLLVALALLTALGSACAEWLDHDELPQWARRGYVRWGHGGNIKGRLKGRTGGHGADADCVRVMIGCHRNLQQTMDYDDEEARRIGEAGGIRRQPYISSKTIWWEREFPQYEGLDQAICRTADGGQMTMYGNPKRTPGCYNNPIWREYMKRRVDKRFEDASHVSSIFFDNVNFYDCRCPYCQASFRNFTREMYGRAMDLNDPSDWPHPEFVKALWQAVCTQDFFEEIKAYIRTIQDPTPISPNFHVGAAWTDYLTWRGTSDIVFYEEGRTFPPFASTVVGYKVGLAASQGRAVGQLLGLPMHVARERALELNPRHEAGIVESFMYPEEHMLALAEAVSCDGTDILSFSLREQKITADDRPDHKAVREALYRYTDFVDENSDLYELAMPGADVAVVYSIYSHLAGRKTEWPLLVDTCEALGAAGVPYEVIIEDDLTPELLAPYRLVILPLVNLHSREHAEALVQYARSGGTLVIIGDAATHDERCLPYDDPPELATLPDGGPHPLGSGAFLRRSADDGFSELSPAQLRAELAEVSGPLTCTVTAQSGRLFANLLTTHEGDALSIHLVNSDFSYDPLPTADARDDDGTPEARTYFASTASRARKVIEVPDPAEREGQYVRFYGQAYGGCTDAMSMIVSLNGRDLQTFPGSTLHQAKWYQVPIPAGLLRESNEIVFRAIGAPNGHPDYFQLRIDTDATSHRSWWSQDEGATWSSDDLSPDKGTQTGEYMVRIGPEVAEDAVAKPEDFMGRLHVHPARNVEVRLRLDGDAPPADLITPDGEGAVVEPVIEDGAAVYRVPQVYVYSVLVLPRG
ncbi:MAG: beta-galactosidase [Armatimonadetes bacterium]|nr:beta-galactosidase [Armatimonadota bacterium]